MGLLPSFPGNPRQGWQFQVLVNGIEAACFQKCTLPEPESTWDTCARIREEALAAFERELRNRFRHRCRSL